MGLTFLSRGRARKFKFPLASSPLQNHCSFIGSLDNDRRVIAIRLHCHPLTDFPPFKGKYPIFIGLLCMPLALQYSLIYPQSGSAISQENPHGLPPLVVGNQPQKIPHGLPPFVVGNQLQKSTWATRICGRQSATIGLKWSL